MTTQQEDGEKLELPGILGDDLQLLVEAWRSIGTGQPAIGQAGIRKIQIRH